MPFLRHIIIFAPPASHHAILVMSNAERHHAMPLLPATACRCARHATRCSDGVNATPAPRGQKGAASVPAT